jgi:Domain of unknown function (DUF4082)/Fibronectin type III domain/Bacterial Ig domain
MTAPSQYRRVFTAALASAFLLLAAFVFVTEAGGGVSFAAAAETGFCAPPVTNPVACENSKPGVPPEQWQVDGIGDETIQGFATQISVNVGQTESFKIKTPSTKYHINILRLGYYGGNGARMIESNLKPSVSLPQTQPECMHEAVAPNGSTATGLIDCGNWAVSASWKVPAEAVSGLYVAELVREDVSGGQPIDHTSQIFFIVKNEESKAPIVLKTSDATWEAYNAWGGNSLYTCTKFCPEGEPEAYKAAFSVSYNRPFDGTLETDSGQSDPLYAEYQLMRFLEKEGYNVTYLAQPDIQAHPELLKNHKVFISSAHDEYWSEGERNAVEAAREAKVNLAFFSGNEIYWKTRWGPSIDSSHTENRTLTTYKETHFNKAVDPLEPKVATSSWADPRFKAGGAGKPDNQISGQYFTVNSGTADIKVPGTFAKLRFWKNTAVSKLNSNETLTLSPGTGTLGYEWDSDVENGFRPAGRIPLSSTSVNGVETFSDYGTHTETNQLAKHSLSLYRAPSGALVFGAGTVQWSWGLDNTNAWNQYATDPSENPPDPTMQQATVNLLAEMGAQPSTLQTGLLTATETTDHTAPTATITSPTSGKTVKSGEAITITGTAVDTGGGVVAAVEVSTDGGKTWHEATGTTSWTYSWNVDGANTATIKARAIDDSANIGAATSGTTISVTCPCSMLGTLTPSEPDSGDNASINLGVKFTAEISGKVEGIRFYKSSANTGTHVGSLWTAGGELLAQATFTSETATGWQSVKFATPVNIQANTQYVASYLAPKGHYADTNWQLVEPPALGSTMLHHPPLNIVDGGEGGNGLFQYDSGTAFPTQSYNATNYWVDVLYTPNTPPLVPGTPTGVSATAGPGRATVNWTAPTSGGAPTSYKVTPYIGTVAQTSATVAAPATSAVVTGLKAGTFYTFTIAGVNEGGTGTESTKSNSVLPTAISAPGAPTGVTATAGGASATVKWTVPASDGGSAITGYKVVPYRSGIAQTSTTVGAEVTTTVVTGLTPGGSYTFKVAAINAIGTGAESSSSNTVVPTTATVPGAPTAVGATAKSSGAVVTWTAPSSNGGSPVSGYKVVPYKAGVAQTATTVGNVTTASVGGLSNATAYTFKVAAINAIGTGAESATASAAVTPYDTIFDLATPGTVDSEDGGAINLGVKFKTSEAGTINGIRFYKAATNVGTHIGDLWGANGELLSQVTFTGETASGWQQAFFTTPVKVQPNTTYVASYLAPSGHYSANGPTLATEISNGPLHALGGEGNGVYVNGSGVNYPDSSYNSSNYWVDVLFVPGPPTSVPAAPTGVTATTGVGASTVSWTAPASDGGSPITGYKVVPYKAGVAQTATTVGAEVTTANVSGLSAGSSYTFKVAAINTVGTGPESAASNAVTPTAPTAPGAPTGLIAAAKSSSATLSWTAPTSNGGSAITGYKVTPYIGATAGTATTIGNVETATVTGLTNGVAYTFKVAAINAIGTSAESTASTAVTPYDTIFDLATPGTVDTEDGSSVNLGVKFKSDVAGTVNGIRFYKAAGNTGSHVGSLWTAGGELLAQVTFSGESASGWQQATFSTPVKIQPNTTYVASYLAPSGHYSVNGPNFATEISNAPLHGLGGEGNGLYGYSSEAKFPTGSYNSSNYWVDVLFVPEAAPVLPGAPTAVTATAGFGQATVTWIAPASNGGGALISYTVTPYIGATAQTPKTITGNPPATGTTVSGLTAGTAYTFKVKATNAAGDSPESAASNAITPEGATVPEAPTAVTASPRDSGAVVTWSEPGDDGGTAITGYKVTPYIGSEALSATNVAGNTTTATIGSLQNGSTYTFKVTAINSVGPGPESAASAAVMARVTLFEAETPANASVEDNGSVVLGVKFSSAIAGQVRGVRFYKSAQNTGTHKIGLWNQWGDLLAEATVTGETASGWQEANFATPVGINANTTYVAGYLAPKGHYAATPQAFATTLTSGPLSGLANGTSPNGLYVYSSTLIFPVGSYEATNYWVDVLFTP